MRNLHPQVWLYNLFVALEAVKSNKVRSTLTALGIIFGVAAVISMLAVGNVVAPILDQEFAIELVRS